MKNLVTLIGVCLLTLVGCGKDHTGSEYAYYPGEAYTGRPAEKTPPPPAPLAPKGEPKEMPAGTPTALPLPAAEPVVKVHSWESYTQAKATELTYWDLAASSALISGVGNSLADIFDPLDTAGRKGTWTHWGYFKSESKKPSPQKSLMHQYDELMDAERYFVRVPKFRAPISKKKAAYYAWFVAVAPMWKSNADRDGLADEASLIKIGEPQYLEPGQRGAGSTSIIAIPRKLVQTGFGYWDESVVIQFGVVEIDREALRSGKSTSAIQRALLHTYNFPFKKLAENEVSRTQSVWTYEGEESAAIDLEWWKGDWKTNRR